MKRLLLVAFYWGRLLTSCAKDVKAPVNTANASKPKPVRQVLQVLQQTAAARQAIPAAVVPAVQDTKLRLQTNTEEKFHLNRNGSLKRNHFCFTKNAVNHCPNLSRAVKVLILFPHRIPGKGHGGFAKTAAAFSHAGQII